MKACVGFKKGDGGKYWCYEILEFDLRRRLLIGNVLEWQDISEKLRLCWGISRIFYSLILGPGILEGHDGGLCYALDDARRKEGSDYRHVK